MKFDDVINCLVICSFIFILVGLQFVTVNNENFKYFNETRRDNLWGIYYRNSYYCVWVKDRTEQQIATTEEHEKCHHLVYLNKKHFCDWYET